MTLVVAQELFQGIVIIADSRASIMKNGEYTPWKDNTQKIFRLYKHLFISFSGDIEFAGSIIGFLLRQVAQRPKIGNIHIFHNKGPKLIRYAYEFLSQKRGYYPPLEFIIAGMDFTRPTKIKNEDGSVSNLAIFDKVLFKFSCPDFSTEEATVVGSPILVMGSGDPAIGEKEREALKKMQFDIRADLPLVFQASVMEYGIKEKIKELGIKTVGGLFQMVTIDLNGSTFHQYKTKSSNHISDELDLELIIRNGRYIQRNLKTGKEIPLLIPPEVIKIKDPSVELFADLE
jgi:hypothetical protein